jgi:hypothetical protein
MYDLNHIYIYFEKHVFATWILFLVQERPCDVTLVLASSGLNESEFIKNDFVY